MLWTAYARESPTAWVTAAAPNASVLSDLDIRVNGAGIDVTASNTIIKSSIVRFNDFDGIVVKDRPLFDNDKNTVQLNRSENNGGRGLVVGGSRNTVARNVVLRNGQDGVEISGSLATVDRTQSKYSGGDGFQFSGSGHVSTLNIALTNEQHGYRVSATGSRFERNTASYNGRKDGSLPADGFGILDTSVGTGTSGTANTYSKNNCTGNGLGNSSPAGLCN